MVSLPGSVAAIHSQVASRHEATSITEEEDGSTTVFIWVGESAEHVLLGPLIATVRELVEQLLNHGGDNVARGDGVDADVELTPFGSEVAG